MTNYHTFYTVGVILWPLFITNGKIILQFDNTTWGDLWDYENPMSTNRRYAGLSLAICKFLKYSYWPKLHCQSILTIFLTMMLKLGINFICFCINITFSVICILNMIISSDNVITWLFILIKMSVNLNLLKELSYTKFILRWL